MSLEECWVPSPHSSEHEVSSFGNVRRIVKSKRNHPPGIMRLRPTPSGYLRVGGFKDGKKADFYVHRLVCEAFHGPAPTPLHEVAHADGNKQNNRASNLSWATHRENEAMKEAHGTRLFGSLIGNSKLSEGEVLAIRAMAGTRPQWVIAQLFGVSQMTVSHISRNKTWKVAA